ncbi:hypothetical protein [Noviherbaspirillum malthae]|uniref:hypothetical protein n=1 Tax=Noviherbaspirillum malthae TaxID=1260987 RepID=UPI0018901184|nr:hypothetical protein [Noviherbaspirillum malthae]
MQAVWIQCPQKHAGYVPQDGAAALHLIAMRLIGQLLMLDKRYQIETGEDELAGAMRVKAYTDRLRTQYWKGEYQ